MSSLESMIAKAICGPERLEQHWHFIGISPMHRALIQRLALAQLPRSTPNRSSIVWKLSSQWHNPYQSELNRGVVEWIDAGIWSDTVRLNSVSQGNNLYPRLHCGCAVRVLWCWNQPNWREFMAVQPWLADVVVYNLATLKSSIALSLKLGQWRSAVSPNLKPYDLNLTQHP